MYQNTRRILFVPLTAVCFLQQVSAWCAGNATTCSNLTASATCNPLQGCIWDGSINRCVGVAYPCTLLDAFPEECAAQQGCAWQRGDRPAATVMPSPQPSRIGCGGEPIPCFRYNSASCAQQTGCFVPGSSATCQGTPLPCGDLLFADQEACPLQQGCKWGPLPVPTPPPPPPLIPLKAPPNPPGPPAPPAPRLQQLAQVEELEEADLLLGPSASKVASAPIQNGLLLSGSAPGPGVSPGPAMQDGRMGGPGGACKGEPIPCAYNTNVDPCRLMLGCQWQAGNCSGVPVPCLSQRDFPVQDACEQHTGCDWLTGPANGPVIQTLELPQVRRGPLPPLPQPLPLPPLLSTTGSLTYDERLRGLQLLHRSPMLNGTSGSAAAAGSVASASAAGAGGPAVDAENALSTMSFTDSIAFYRDNTYLRWRCSITAGGAGCSDGCHQWLNSTGYWAVDGDVLVLEATSCRASPHEQGQSPCNDFAGYTRGGVYEYTLSIPDSGCGACQGCRNCLRLSTDPADPRAEVLPYEGSTQDYQLQYIQALADPCQQYVRQS